MGRVTTNSISQAIAVEASLGVLPAQPVWYLLEPNSIDRAGAELGKVSRSPISKNRQRRKGTVVDLDSAVEGAHDLTYSFLDLFGARYLFSKYIGTSLRGGTLLQSLAASTSAFTHSALSAAIPSGRLLVTRGFANTVNNSAGRKSTTNPAWVVQAAGTTTNTPVLKYDGTGPATVAETPSLAQGAQLEIAGVRGATGDIQINASGHLISTVLDFTTLGLTVGQMIHVGGFTTAHQFATAANTGRARVEAIAANLLTLSHRSQAFATDAGTGKTIEILFGRFARNVPIDHADFVQESLQTELAYPNLQNPGPGDAYEYPKGNLTNDLDLTLPLTNKATYDATLIGTDTPVPTTTRATNASTPVAPNAAALFGTSTDIARLRIQKLDESSLTTDIKSATLAIGNNVNPEKVLATLGAKYMNFGNLEIDVEMQVLFTDPAIKSAIRDNDTVSLDGVLVNDDGGVGYDIPAGTLDLRGTEFPVNESVLVNTTLVAHQDPVLGYSMSLSLFPVLP